MHFTLPLYYISIDPYICFGLCKNHHQGVSKLHTFTSNGISVLIVMQYLRVQLPFTYNISLKSELFKNAYRRTKYKIVENSLKFVSRR
jgi:hypothetical protein